MSDLKNIYFYRKNFSCQVAGFIVPAEFIRNQSLQQIEKILGFSSGRLSKGAAFAQLTSLPSVVDLEYYGDTSSPEHHFESKRNKSIKKGVLTRAAYNYIQPTTVLIKVIPLKDINPMLTKDENWPSGAGAMQFKLKKLKPAIVIDVIEDYPYGKFR